MRRRHRDRADTADRAARCIWRDDGAEEDTEALRVHDVESVFGDTAHGKIDAGALRS